jgi:solute carrier family 35, member E1
MVFVSTCRCQQLAIHLHSRSRNCSTRIPKEHRVCCSPQASALSSRRDSETQQFASGSLDANGSASSLRLSSYVALWFGTSCVFNIINKLTLQVFPMPLFLSAWQLAASSMFMVSLWVLGLHPKPNLPPRFLFHLLPVALFHTVGHVAACVSFTKMAVSFTHVVKSSEPVFTVGLSTKLLGVWCALLLALNYNLHNRPLHRVSNVKLCAVCQIANVQMLHGHPGCLQCSAVSSRDVWGAVTQER